MSQIAAIALLALRHVLRSRVVLVLSALLFAAGHVALHPTPYRLLTFFPGLLLGWGRKNSGNVYVPLIVHFIFNLFPSLLGGVA